MTVPRAVDRQGEDHEQPAVLCLNAGSSSLKAAWYAVGGSSSGPMSLALRGRVLVDALGTAEARLRLTAPDGETVVERQLPGCDPPGALSAVLQAVADAGTPLAAVGHRIVHGGPHVSDHCRVTPAVLDQLRAAIPFAPLHVPAELAAVASVAAAHPELPQVVCLDTAFHRHLPDVARRFALPDELVAGGVQRYGFHGLSCEYVAGRVGAGLGRAVIAHLGNGASLTAVAGGVSVDTTMGLTPLGGIVMGTRPGDLDPGVLVHLLRRGMTVEEVDDALTHRSGLLGLSGGATNDVRLLLERRSAGDERAAAALAAFTYSVRKAVGALAAALGGLDTLVFTAGVGEHAGVLRAEIAGGLGHLGVVVDPVVNGGLHPTPGGVHAIGDPAAPVAVLVVPTDEERVIATHTTALADLPRDARVLAPPR